MICPYVKDLSYYYFLINGKAKNALNNHKNTDFREIICRWSFSAAAESSNILLSQIN